MKNILLLLAMFPALCCAKKEKFKKIEIAGYGGMAIYAAPKYVVSAWNTPLLAGYASKAGKSLTGMVSTSAYILKQINVGIAYGQHDIVYKCPQPDNSVVKIYAAQPLRAVTVFAHYNFAIKKTTLFAGLSYNHCWQQWLNESEVNNKPGLDVGIKYPLTSHLWVSAMGQYFKPAVAFDPNSYAALLGASFRFL